MYGVTVLEIRTLAETAESMGLARIAYGNVMVGKEGAPSADSQRGRILEQELAAAKSFYDGASKIFQHIDQAFRETTTTEVLLGMLEILREELKKFAGALREIGRAKGPAMLAGERTIARLGMIGGLQINPAMFVLRCASANVLTALRHLLGIVAWSAPELKAA
jgi:hypothetical protein